jgi:hypothetical protein
VFFRDATAATSLRNLLHSAVRTDLAADYEDNVVHLCSVCEGEVALQEFSLALRSLEALRKTQRVIYHVATSETQRGNLTALFSSRDDNITGDVFVPDESLISKWANAAHFVNRVSWRKKVAKIYMFRLLPQLKRCIVLDTDIMFGKDISELWSEFELFKPQEVIAATWRPALMPGDKVNAGVMLMDFEKMRESSFSDRYQETPAYSMAIGRETNTLGLVTPWLPEQETLEGVLDDKRIHGLRGLIRKPRSLRALDEMWNLEMCQDFGNRCNGLHAKAVRFGILHGNCAETDNEKANFNLPHISTAGDRPEQPWWMSAKFKPYASCFNLTTLLSQTPG